MTNEKIDAALAEKVMEWKLVERYENGSALWSYGVCGRVITGIESGVWSKFVMVRKPLAQGARLRDAAGKSIVGD